MENNWTNKLSCFSPNFVEHKVGDQILHFYPVSVGLVFKLRVIGKPLARSLSVLFGKGDQDHGTKDLTVSNANGTQDRQIVIEPITEGLARIRHEQRIAAIEGMVDALTDDKNAATVGEIIMDSLREVFPRSDRKDWPPASEFINTLPLPALGAMLVGVAKANQEVFGPLAGKVVAAAESAVDRIAAERSPTSQPISG